MVCLVLPESNLNSTMSLLQEDILPVLRHQVCSDVASCNIWIPITQLLPDKGAISSS